MLWVLADGMGGTAGGREAATLTVSSIYEFVRVAAVAAEVTWPFGYDLEVSYETNVLRTAVQLANLKVCRAAEEAEQFAEMGSTAVVVWVRGKTAFWTHVGDSRLYLWRDGELQQLSTDHSLVQEQLRQGIITQDEAKTHSLRHVVTRAIGSRDRFTIDVQAQLLRSGDLLLLCSDGLSNQVEHQEICAILRDGTDLQVTCQWLVAAANEAGGEDNITAVLFRYED
jgi:serine/threonine protein phosphatase PrpC